MLIIMTAILHYENLPLEPTGTKNIGESKKNGDELALEIEIN